MAGEAHSCLEELLKSVPRWLTDLENVVETAAQKQDELLESQQLVDRDKTLVRKLSNSSSLLSRRSKRRKIAPTEAEAVTAAQIPFSPTEPAKQTTSDILRLAQRKRKTVSVLSGRQSGPSKYRTKTVAIIYYNGDVQKRFETLVKTISLCRNTIRKAKMSYKIDSLARRGSSGSESGSGGEGMTKGFGLFTYKTTRKARLDKPRSKDVITAVFDELDALLEKTQTLCEQAAHQVLRDGDCSVEVSKAKEHLFAVKSTASSELPMLSKQAEQEVERRRRSEEDRRLREEERQKQGILRPDSQKIELLGTFNSDSPLEVDPNEYDDDDDSDGGIDFGALQMPASLSKYGMRSPRFAAVH
jgi:hypothetical protein